MKDTDADVRWLRQLLAMPSERELPSGRQRRREEHLMESLQEMTGTQTRSRRAVAVRRWALVGGAVAVAAAAVVFVATAVLGPAPTPAYAVSTDDDGSVTITVNHAGDPADANEQLRQAAVRATVILPSAESACPAGDRQGVTIISFHRSGFATQLVPAPDYLEVIQESGQASRVRIRPGDIPAGQLLIITPVESSAGMVIQVGSSDLSGPSCIISFAETWGGSVPVPSSSPSPES
ncbi:hypothetical protein F4553_000532 [Allocatelliglobosispora scoriae]|uniref:Uncharacterized protein n=1 Tax=Allocatelliglobosispora scoriae TaxID=643052 RepID=A0A841BJE0_9ACTN|nr:hypothetical protein [Allocatelliglobosispora scoriae]MBB5867153.1 hypothetical protein [Allocatelliglobosispora scoriae]